MANIKFSLKTKAEYQVVNAIAQRAAKLAAKHGIDYPVLDADMDICATHLNGNPLKLVELLAADDSNFAHDVFGIRKHIDRTTGKLMDCFSPRYSSPEAPADTGTEPAKAKADFKQPSASR